MIDQPMTEEVTAPLGCFSEIPEIEREKFGHASICLLPGRIFCLFDWVHELSNRSMSLISEARPFGTWRQCDQMDKLLIHCLAIFGRFPQSIKLLLQ